MAFSHLFGYRAALLADNGTTVVPVKSPERVDVHVRIPRELYLRLAARAAENDRTINGELCAVLRSALVGGYQLDRVRS